MTVRLLRRSAVLLTTAALTLGGAVSAAEAAPPASSGPGPRVVSVFPNNDLTVADHTQRTDRRVNLPMPNCAVRPTDCNTVKLLNQLDGFDLDPRLALTFDRDVDPAVIASGLHIARVGAPWSTGVDRVVYDATTHTVYAHPQQQLAPDTTYRMSLDLPRPGRTGKLAPPALFTTLSATDGLTDMVHQLDNGSAYSAASIPPDARGLHVDAEFPATTTTALAYTEDLGSSKTKTVPVPNLSGTAAGQYIFGSYLAPSWLTPAGDIPQTPTKDAGPRVLGQARLPFVAIVPAGTAPAGGWPVAVFGHGFTRSDTDLFLAASQNAVRGMATIATDVVGHGYGPNSTWQVTSGVTTTTEPAHARGIDRDHNGTIDSTEGVSTLPQPAPLAQVNNRDGLRQTVADVSTLVRAIGSTPKLNGQTLLRPTGVTYYGQSFGGIYGAMLGGVDKSLQAVGLNVPGGPISEIARLSPSFRPLVTQSLALAQPPLLNGGNDGFTESLPLAGEPPVTTPAAGALPIQQFLAEGTWINRSGSPETFAPLLSANRTLVQSAFGDRTVPNPTASTLIRAGNLQSRTSLYRNDKTPNFAANPHGFLLNPSFSMGFINGQTQMSTFLASGGTTVIDPDGPLPVWEVPVTDPSVLMRLNFYKPPSP